MLNSVLLDFATWLSEQSWSIGLHESLYMYNWIETTHVLTLMVSLGMLCIIDLRMLGLAFTSVPASRIAERLDKPMLIGFSVMLITGVLLYGAIPIRTTQSLWFRIKVILLIAAAVNAWLFRRHMQAAVHSWDSDPVPPRRTRIRRGIVAGALGRRHHHRTIHRVRLVRLRSTDQFRVHQLGRRLHRGRQLKARRTADRFRHGYAEL